MTENVSLVHGESVAIKKVASADASVEFDKERVNSLKKQGRGGPVAVEIEFEKLSSFNQVEFRSNSGLIELNVFYLNEIGAYSRIPVLGVDARDGLSALKLPLIRAKAVQLVFYKTQGEFTQLSLSGLHFLKNTDLHFSATSNYDRLWVAENLVDGRSDYGWSSVEGSKEETIEIELGSLYFINELRLQSTPDHPSNFPTRFSVLVSPNGHNWQPVIAEDNFFVSSNSWYSWAFRPSRAGFLRIVMENTTRGSLRILELDIRGIPENELQNKNDMIHQGYASEVIAGDVLLAENNSAAPNRAVQANDSRLRQATAESAGIVQLARDNQVKENLVVQSNDSRLKLSTENTPGIIQLAKDGEARKGVAIQGSDYRLTHATDKKAGIVQLANDGDTRPGAVVQGSDSRLKASTTSSPGIVRLAENGEVKPNAVVQADDNRLRQASTSWPGIVQLANHDDSTAGMALQADDPRLHEGDENHKGRVVFARDGENAELKAVQGSDRRLSYASEEKEGIIRFAKSGIKAHGVAVQADDERLDDARKPLPHDHDYAAKQHELNDHTGPLNIAINKTTQDLKGFVVPDPGGLPFSVKNTEGWAAGFQGGIVTSSKNSAAIKAIANEHSALEASSREQAAAVLLSEKDYALFLPAKYNGAEGSGKSIMVQGRAVFKDRVDLKGALSIEVEWDKISSEAFTEGDLIAVNPDGVFEKIKNVNQVCLGIFSIKSKVALKKEQKPKKGMLISLTGIVKVRVNGPIVAGKYVGYSGGNPGVATEMPQGSSVNAIGVALESSSGSGEKLVTCLLKG